MNEIFHDTGCTWSSRKLVSSRRVKEAFGLAMNEKESVAREKPWNAMRRIDGMEGFGDDGSDEVRFDSFDDGRRRSYEDLGKHKEATGERRRRTR